MTTPAPRRSETPAMARRICFAQGEVPCGICGVKLEPTDKTIREHLHALARGGKDDEGNMAYVHFKCADEKTNGKGATTLGSDSHEIAKTKRLVSGGRKRKGRKLQSRGFDKTRSKKLNGEVEKRIV